MSAIPAYITTGLRFPTDEIQCRGDRWRRGCAAADEGAGYAIHTFEGNHYCGYHSPFDNQYVPCHNCGEKPALKAQSPDDDPICDDCLIEINQVTEYDNYLAATGAHDLRHPSRPAPADLTASDYIEHHPQGEGDPSCAPDGHAPDGGSLIVTAST
ncbi:hypothetical protein [Streptomyces sp. NPDC005989]|uniref:hypothetical protein n=1 Tax=Streptomyces sp. NPDC005989 TaxID=3156727 RepID=UPI0033FC67D1